MSPPAKIKTTESYLDDYFKVVRIETMRFLATNNRELPREQVIGLGDSTGYLVESGACTAATFVLIRLERDRTRLARIRDER